MKTGDWSAFETSSSDAPDSLRKIIEREPRAINLRAVAGVGADMFDCGPQERPLKRKIKS